MIWSRLPRGLTAGEERNAFEIDLAEQVMESRDGQVAGVPFTATHFLLRHFRQDHRGAAGMILAR